jgi:hypothetical protein
MEESLIHISMVLQEICKEIHGWRGFHTPYQHRKAESPSRIKDPVPWIFQRLCKSVRL